MTSRILSGDAVHVQAALSGTPRLTPRPSVIVFAVVASDATRHRLQANTIMVDRQAAIVDCDGQIAPGALCILSCLTCIPGFAAAFVLRPAMQVARARVEVYKVQRCG